MGLLRRTALAILLLSLASCVPATQPPAPASTPAASTPDHLLLRAVSFDALTGWKDDRQGQALAALVRSCARFTPRSDAEPVGPEGIAGLIRDWRAPCAAASRLDPKDDAAARRFFETNFTPFAAAGNDGGAGLFTGYYELELHGSRQRSARFATPLLRRPPDLVSVDLGEYRPAWRGERIAGRVVDGRLRPYEARAEIETGALAAKHLELLWVADPIAAFFLQIQGSGRVVLPDGSVAPVGFDGQNGRPYVPVGRILVERGALKREEVSMQAIAAWMRAHPESAQALMNENPSYVFFQEVPGDGPLGSQGVVLTPGRSLAVDTAFLALGLPLWLDVADEGYGGAALRRLVVAQDTGGAIRGAVRGDLFWGHGPEAEERAGRMRARGAYFLLLPATVAARRGPNS